MPPLRFIEQYMGGLPGETIPAPENAAEAQNGKDKRKWKEAMEVEMGSLKYNGVYVLVDRPKGNKVVKSKWVFKVKTNAEGEVENFKARVVSKGYSQVQGVDYDQFFSPTVQFESVRGLVALGASRGLKMHQRDFTTAFLYAPLEEEDFMEQPEGTLSVVTS